MSVQVCFATPQTKTHAPSSPSTHSSNKPSFVRQSSDITASFPLKSFQKFNSETVEIPGLNVKTVRYRIEDDLGKLDPHLYKNFTSVGTALGGKDQANPSRAKLFFNLSYNEDIKSLSVTVNRAEILPAFASACSTATGATGSNNLSVANSNSLLLNGGSSPSALASASAPNSPTVGGGGSASGKPDTYVRVQLLPDKKRKYQTKVQRKTFAPVYEETFYFQLAFDDLQHKTLLISQYECGRFSKHELVGSVRIVDLHTIKNLTSSDVEFQRPLLYLPEVGAYYYIQSFLGICCEKKHNFFLSI